jgi:predicted DCC family thiol-disulfide oxidoreductase YuxK
MATVIYDSYCRICTETRRICEWLDWFRLLEWQSFEDSGLSPDQLWFVRGERRWGGFRAVKRVAARLPALYLAMLAGAIVSPWTLVVWAVIFSPPFQPAGDWIYSWIARKRSCSI